MFDVKAAYYYDDPDDAFLKDFMIEKFNADVYNPDSENYFNALIANLTKYGLVVVEHPLLSTSVFEASKGNFENYVSIGGLLMLSGEIVSAQGREMLDVQFYKKSGQSISDRNSTVNQSDDYLAFQVGENIVFAQAYYVTNTPSAENFSAIVRFNQDSNIALARWDYGNGATYYFSDFDATYFSGNFVEAVEDAALEWVGGKCIIDRSNVDINNLVKIDRFLTYNKATKFNIAKMVLHLWS